jgi:hypothetical protein
MDIFQHFFANDPQAITLKGLSHQIFKAFYDLRYQICTFCVGADGLKTFSFSGYFNIWILMYNAPNTA